MKIQTTKKKQAYVFRCSWWFDRRIVALHHEQQISEGSKAHVTNSSRKIIPFRALNDPNIQILSSDQQID